MYKIQFKKILRFLASLKLTLSCFLFILFLICIGTLYQIDFGVFAAKEKIFRAFIIYWQPKSSQLKIPLFPGGYFLAILFLLNLMASLIYHFRFSYKTLGILLAHIGLFSLVCTELLSGMISSENLIPLKLGQKYNYSLEISDTESIDEKRKDLPFLIELIEFKHETHPGTLIPKHFSSLVKLYSKEGVFDRSALISMNHPLRYRGKKLYQASYGEDNTLSVIQVVDNPAYVLSYLFVSLVIIGMVYQFIGGVIKK